MVSNRSHFIDFKQSGNNLFRNLNCTFGGDKIKIQIKNPRIAHIVGIKIHIYPYVPKQLNEEAQVFKNTTLTEDFMDQPEIIIKLDVIPEYSYNLSVSFNCQFGSLPGSKNITSKGEIERMINKVGCYARNDFYFMNDTGTQRTFVGSSIECAQLCHTNSSCQLGWRYQISTKKCYFIENVTISVLKPDMDTIKRDDTKGWISGLKSCFTSGRETCIAFN